MEQIVAVFRKTGQTVPVFNDKHLSYTYDKARQDGRRPRENCSSP